MLTAIFATRSRTATAALPSGQPDIDAKITTLIRRRDFQRAYTVCQSVIGSDTPPS